MPNPTVSDVHVNAALSNVSVRHALNSGDFIAGSIFPTVPVNHRSNLYWKHSKSDWRRTQARKRAPGTESAGDGWKMTQDTYFCDVLAIHKDIDYQTRANADSNFNLDADATRFVTNQLLLRRDIDWANTYFRTGVWDTEYSGVPDTQTPGAGEFVRWDEAGSDPLTDETRWQLGFRRLVGVDFNFMVLGAEVYAELIHHPAILERIKYTQKGVVTKELLASFFSIPPERLKVAYSSQAIGPEINDADLQDDAADYEFIVPTTSMLLGYAPSRPSVNTPSAGYTFTWRGFLGQRNSQGIGVKRIPAPLIESDRVEAQQCYDMKIVSTDCGVFVDNVVLSQL